MYKTINGIYEEGWLALLSGYFIYGSGLLECIGLRYMIKLVPGGVGVLHMTGLPGSFSCLGLNFGNFGLEIGPLSIQLEIYRRVHGRGSLVRWAQ